MKALACILTAGTALVAAAPSAEAAIIANSPYLCFDRSTISGCGTADSPFATKSYSYFHLETVEDGLVNTPGVSTSLGLGVIGPRGANDSVDADDGVIDGSGTNGRSLFGESPHIFTFDSAVLGALPTDVGIVWTDGTGDHTFSFFDAGGGLLGSVTQRLGDDEIFGTTAEDRFFGWTGNVGIGSFRVSGSTMELDHLQYGFAAPVTGAVPEPATWAMMIAGFGLVGSAMRRRRRPGLALS